MSEHILDELSWRGLIAQSTDLDALRRDLDAGPLTLYCGFDPTSPSLHAGNLVPLVGLRRFQRMLTFLSREEIAALTESAAEKPQLRAAQRRLAEEPTIVDLLVSAGLVASKGAARRTVSEGGAYVNNTKITDEEWRPSKEDLLHGRWLVLRRGKRTTAGVDVHA